MAAVWTPWSWSSGDGSDGGDDGPPFQQQQGADQRKQRERQGREPGGDAHQASSSAACFLSGRPRSAPAPTTTGSFSASVLPQQPAAHRQAEGADDNHNLDLSPPLAHEKAARSSSAGDLPRWRSGGPAVAPGRASARSKAGMGEGRRGWGFGNEASAASPDFRRLGPSDCRSTPLAGCDFDALGTMGLSGGGTPLAVAGERSSDGETRFRPEALMMPCRRSSSPSQDGRQRSGNRPRSKKTQKTTNKGKKKETRTAASLSAAAPDTAPGARPFSCSLEDGLCVGRGGFETVDSTSSGDGASSSTRRDLSRAPASLSTQSSSSSLGSTSAVSIAATLDLWNSRELAAAKRAVSSRPRRSRLCLAMRAQESTSAGMAAAQRSLRGAFVMSKMGNAKSRSRWRP